MGRNGYLANSQSIRMTPHSTGPPSTIVEILTPKASKVFSRVVLNSNIGIKIDLSPHSIETAVEFSVLIGGGFNRSLQHIPRTCLLGFDKARSFGAFH